MDIVDWFEKKGPATRKDYASASPERGERACNSEVDRAFNDKKLLRVVVDKGEGRGPEWLYYTNEESLIRQGTNLNIYVPLRKLNDFKKEIVIQVIKRLISEGCYEGRLELISRRAGYSPNEIENEAYAVAQGLEFKITEHPTRDYIGL